MSSRIIASEKSMALRSIVDMTGANSLFGTIGSGAFPILSRMDFVPENRTGKTIKLTGEGDGGNPRWIGLDSKIMQFWAYVYCSPLGSVIDRLAEADVNGIMRFIDAETGVPVKNPNKVPRLARIKKLLTKPNPWQTWEEFDAEQVVFCKIFGYCPVFAINPGFEDKSYTSALININPILVTPIAKSDFSLFEGDGLIKEWHLNILGTSYVLPAKDVFVVKDGFVSKSDGLGLPISKVLGMDFIVSNFCASQEADNVILKKKGPLGIFSWDPAKDMAGHVPLEPDAKEQLQSDLSQYGLTIGQIQYVISKMPVKFHPISFNIRDLMTKETMRAAIDNMCDRFSYPAELMSGKNATYENRNSSEKWLYNNNVIPFSVRRTTRYNNFFDLQEVIIRKDFDHLPVLQEDIVKAGEAEKYQSEALQVEWEMGMLTWNQWQVAKGRDSVSGMDIYYPEYIKKFPMMNKNQPKQLEKPKKDGKTSSEGSGTQK